MKKNIVILVLATLLLLSGCDATKTIDSPDSLTAENSSSQSEAMHSDDSIDSSSNANQEIIDSEASKEVSESSIDAIIPKAYVDVLQSNKTFYFEFDSKDTYFKDYLELFYPGYDIASLKIAIIDFDSDGIEEIVVSTGDTGSIVLHVEKDMVYGYEFSYRSMNTIKKDGSFAWSNSAVNNGWSKIKFDGSKYQLVNTLVVGGGVPSDPSVESWQHNDVEISETEYSELELEQINKEDITWYDFPASSLM